jgi:hypothetical protein
MKHVVAPNAVVACAAGRIQAEKTAHSGDSCGHHPTDPRGVPRRFAGRRGPNAAMLPALPAEL